MRPAFPALPFSLRKASMLDTVPHFFFFTRPVPKRAIHLNILSTTTSEKFTERNRRPWTKTRFVSAGNLSPPGGRKRSGTGATAFFPSFHGKMQLARAKQDEVSRRCIALHESIYVEEGVKRGWYCILPNRSSLLHGYCMLRLYMRLPIAPRYRHSFACFRMHANTGRRYLYTDTKHQTNAMFSILAKPNDPGPTDSLRFLDRCDRILTDWNENDVAVSGHECYEYLGEEQRLSLKDFQILETRLMPLHRGIY